MSVRRRAERSWAEWVTLALSVAVIGMLLAVALREESRVLGNDETYIEVTFDPVRATKRDGAHYVPYTVTNTGAVAIESAEIWLEVHEQGRSVVSTGSREQAERDTVAMHSYGLWATFQTADA